MSNLILSFISIALIAATAAATIFFGGDAVRGGTDAAHAATLKNIGSQVSGYSVMYWASTGEEPTDIFGATDTTLEGAGYLKTNNISTPHGGAVSLNADTGFVEFADVPTEVCDAINDDAGLDSRPALPIDLSDPDAYDSGVFACYGDAGSAGTAVFK